MSISSKFYVTTPIYYVNDRPHIGHAYTTILADVLARYHRLLDMPTYFLTGTDEHGQKVFEAAQQHGVTPREQCDSTVVRFQELWRKLEITNDDFIRTTEARHQQVVQEILLDLYERDEIYAADYEGWYCVPCERFYMEKDLTDGNCPECQRAVQRLVERNYFFRMSKYQDWLVSYIHEHPEFIQPSHRRHETLGFLRQPLGDLCVSRPKTRLSWGIELPFDPDYVTYVWFDALVNYISAVGYRRDADKFQQWWPASYHLIGKDILTTHTVYWPTMLKAMGVEMPQAVFAHGWWLIGKDKMSKSLGNVVNPMEMAEVYGVDAFRYFLMAEMSLGQDALFTETAFTLRYNADLANDLGNLASRVIKMGIRNLGGKLEAVPAVTEDEAELVTLTLTAVTRMQQCLENMQLDRGLAEVLAAVRAGNRYFEKMAPWQLAKSGRNEDLQRVIYHAAECLRIVSALLFPVMPEKMTALRQALGIGPERMKPHFAELSAWGGLPAGTLLSDPDSLFPRIERTKLGDNNGMTAGPKTPARAAASKDHGEGIEGLIEFSEFQKVKLTTAKVVTATPVPGADKLLRLEVDIGAEQRQIVAGIAEHYQPSEIVGKTVVVVSNLKPATIRGVESQGMLLAARSGRKLVIVTVDGAAAPGSSVG